MHCIITPTRSISRPEDDRALRACVLRDYSAAKATVDCSAEDKVSVIGVETNNAWPIR